MAWPGSNAVGCCLVGARVHTVGPGPGSGRGEAQWARVNEPGSGVTSAVTGPEKDPLRLRQVGPSNVGPQASLK